MAIIRFDDALESARDAIAAKLKDNSTGIPPIIVRGVSGRLRLFRENSASPFDDAWAEQLCSTLGAFAEDHADFLLSPSDFYDSSIITEAEDLQDISPEADGPPIQLLDRLPHGEDWLRSMPRKTDGNCPRAVLFGIKGGVGRSTALAVWAWWLAQQGKRVLVVDLDLESPGLGAILLPDALTPRFGVVDWLVEDSVGQADADVLRRMMVESPLSDPLEGRICVIPAAGNQTDWYAAKLLRATLDLPTSETGEDGTFSGRLQRLLCRLEQEFEPDIVLLDSRAGLHDIAAVSLTRLGATGFLFAANTAQTWKAYQILFGTWARHRQIRELRERLQMVAATIPPNARTEYLAEFREHSWMLWQSLYDAVAPYDDMEAFNFDRDADNAPHNPLLIEWEERLRHFDPVVQPEALNPAYIDAAYGKFLTAATALVMGNAGLPEDV